ncbi:MAG TPA: copper homeostasis protein CutC, partial [Terriglobales bacterium]|nr:copper homeostasis protein CutC [Terriglobales bacterium]
MAKVLLEICCSSIDDAIEAERGGADRVELCSALFLGGLTPSLGTLLEAKSRLRIPIIFMVRPRSGGFCYTEAEFATMLRDAEAAVAHGADGVVFGILKPDGEIDRDRTHAMQQVIGDRQAVFHR